MSSISHTERQQVKNHTACTLLFVDDEANILSSLKRLFRPLGYKIVTAQNGIEGLAVLKQQQIDLVISDMRMPEMDGAAFLKQVAAHWPDTVRILLTGYADLSSTITAVNSGQIYRYISKPWEENDITLSVKRALEQKQLAADRVRLEALTCQQNEELRALNDNLEDKVQARTNELQQTVSFLEMTQKTLENSYQTTVEVFSNLIEMREQHTGLNRQIAEQVLQLGQMCDMDTNDLHSLRYAALLRNIGKLGLSDRMLNKSISIMDEKEHKTFARHPLISEGVLMALEPLHAAAHIIHHHQEQIDGEGYPDQLTAENIPLGARILKIVSDYHDLQQGLLLPDPLSAAASSAYIKKYSGRHYDLRIVELFLKLLGQQAERANTVSERRVMSGEIESGMVLSRDLMLNKRVLLLSKGHRLGGFLIQRLQHLEESSDNDLDIYIIDNDEVAL